MTEPVMTLKEVIEARDSAMELIEHVLALQAHYGKSSASGLSAHALSFAIAIVKDCQEELDRLLPEEWPSGTDV